MKLCDHLVYKTICGFHCKFRFVHNDNAWSAKWTPGIGYPYRYILSFGKPAKSEGYESLKDFMKKVEAHFLAEPPVNIDELMLELHRTEGDTW